MNNSMVKGGSFAYASYARAPIGLMLLILSVERNSRKEYKDGVDSIIYLRTYTNNQRIIRILLKFSI